MDSEIEMLKNNIQKQILENIKITGWSVINVTDPEIDIPDFAYSVGMYKTLKSPEIIIYGMEEKSAKNIINSIGKAIENGLEIKTNTTYHQFIEDSWSCTFIKVEKEFYKNKLGFNIWLYETNNFPLLQCVWADEKGLYPWESGFNEKARHLQELLVDKIVS